MLVTVFLPSKKSTSTTPSYSQKTVAITYLTDLSGLNLIRPDDPYGSHCLGTAVLLQDYTGKPMFYLL